MLLGSGLIARALKRVKIDTQSIIIAAGVSDSTCILETEFYREKKLIEASLKKNKKIIYFSSQSCANNALKTPYITHKRNIERMILQYSPHNVVLRIPQIASCLGNPNNLINSFYNLLVSQQVITCYDGAKRNLIKDVDIKEIYKHLIRENLSGLLSFCAPYNYSPLEILNSMEKVSKLKAKINIIHKKNQHDIFLCSEEFSEVEKKIFPSCRDEYLSEIIKYAIHKK
jgi:nucleoside-diphosphate-sugar epimerase